MGERMFPIMGGESIPWTVLAPCDRQCQRNHGGQTLEAIAKRGGLGPEEAVDVLLGQTWCTTKKGGSERLREIVNERWYLPRIAALEADYHEVMGLLKRSKMKHGTCDPPERNACTACNAIRRLDELIEGYRGGTVVAAKAQETP